MAYLERINIYPVKSVEGIPVARSRVLARGALEHDRRFAIVDAQGELVNGKRTPAVHRLRLDYDPSTAAVVLRPSNGEAAGGGEFRGGAVGQAFQPDGDPTSNTAIAPAVGQAFQPDGDPTSNTAIAPAVGQAFQPDGDQLGAPPAPFHEAGHLPASEWLGRYLGLTGPARLIENALTGFPDDTDSPGPTVVASATLAAVAEWFGLTVAEIRGRFRPNLEIAGVEPFWEDRLYGPVGQDVEFAIGAVRFAGTNPCQRCPVPGRWVATGEIGPDPAFAKLFAQRRQASLPAWADARRFDHHYRLATNTRLATIDAAGEIAVGDTVTIAAAVAT